MGAVEMSRTVPLAAVSKSALAILVGALCFVLALSLNGRDATARGYEDQTSETLLGLILAVNQLNAGNPDEAQATLDRIHSSAEQLIIQAENLRELAVREYERCGAGISNLEIRIGEIRTEQEALNQQIDGLSEKLAAAVKDEQLNQQEIADLSAEMDKATAAARARQRKMEELRKWWWVPGYGQYLAIRTLADDDIGQYRRLLNTLNDRKGQLQSGQQALRAAKALKAELQSEKARKQQAHGQLEQMYRDAAKRNQELRQMAVFLGDAEVFWSEMKTVLDSRVQSSRKDLKLLASLLQKETGIPRFQKEFTSRSVTLHEALIELATSLDTKKNFLLQDTTEYCGGPGRSTALGRITTKCNIERFTQHYEIVDPKTCTFRYLNPPGCPPPPKEVSAKAQSAANNRNVVTNPLYQRNVVKNPLYKGNAGGAQGQAKGNSRGRWVRATDQNWIGRSRCFSPQAMYFGLTGSADACEKICMTDSQCAFWTYNLRNGYMPRSIRECWGGTATLQPNRQKWTGFISGGLTN
jgi:predicted  nucleic acid-binding Zn-ribbon protein